MRHIVLGAAIALGLPVMTRAVLAGVAALSVLSASAAHAAEPILACSAPEIFQGDVGKYPIVSIAIWHDDRTWKVHHFTADNQIAEREKQYDIEERSTYYISQWKGILRKNPFITMVGQVGRDQKTRKLTYHEWLYDNMGEAPKVIMRLGTFCEPPTTEDMPKWLTENPPLIRVLRP